MLPFAARFLLIQLIFALRGSSLLPDGTVRKSKDGLLKRLKMLCRVVFSADAFATIIEGAAAQIAEQKMAEREALDKRKTLEFRAHRDRSMQKRRAG